MDLNRNYLVGKFSAVLLPILDCIRFLILNVYVLGTIPPGLGRLPNLMWLDLSSNKLTGVNAF